MSADRGSGGSDYLTAPVADEGDMFSKGRAFLGRFLKAERRIFAYILTPLPPRAGAEDVHQEVSVFLWEKFNEAVPPADFAAWGCRPKHDMTWARPLVDQMDEVALHDRPHHR